MILDVFREMLEGVTKDGGQKRARGEKPPWYEDDSHYAAIFSHLSKRAHGELVDPDSGQHPYVHLAWRALAIAYQETNGRVPPHSVESVYPEHWIVGSCTVAGCRIESHQGRA